MRGLTVKTVTRVIAQVLFICVAILFIFSDLPDDVSNARAV